MILYSDDNDNKKWQWELGGPPTMGLCQLHRRAELQALQAKTWYFLEVDNHHDKVDHMIMLITMIIIIYHHDQCTRVPPVCWRRVIDMLLLSKLITVIIIMIIMVGYHDHDHHGYHDQCSRVPPVCWRRGKQRHMHWWWRWTALLRKKGADSVPFDIFVSIAWINQSFSCLCSRCQMRTALTPTPWPMTRMTSTPTSLTSEE